MRPAVCSVCGKSAVSENSNKQGDWVEFKNYQAQNAVNLSHPVGLEFFCSEHLAAAIELSGFSSNDALQKLRLIYPNTDSTSKNIHHQVPWWKRLIGYK